MRAEEVRQKLTKNPKPIKNLCTQSKWPQKRADWTMSGWRKRFAWKIYGFQLFVKSVKIAIKLILVSGRTHTFNFSASTTAGDIINVCVLN